MCRNVHINIFYSKKYKIVYWIITVSLVFFRKNESKKKEIKPIVIAAFATLLMAVFIVKNNTNKLKTNQVQATRQTIPKKMFKKNHKPVEWLLWFIS